MYGVDMSRPGAQAYYDSIVRLYAGWGVDFIKADDILRPIHRDEIAAIHQAIVKTGPAHRAEPFALGPRAPRTSRVPAENANMWRVSDDFWDDWRLLHENFTAGRHLGRRRRSGRLARWRHASLGRIGIVAERGTDRHSQLHPHRAAHRDEPVEHRSIAPYLRRRSAEQRRIHHLQLITNDEVLAVNQKGAHGREFFSSGEQRVWVADSPDSGAKYLGVFNLGERDQDIRIQWPELGLPPACVLRDLWDRKDLGPVWPAAVTPSTWRRTRPGFTS
jgi:alpha-galactosidase